MNTETIDDLKQFIYVTMAQQLLIFKDEFKLELDVEFKKLEDKIDDLYNSVADALDKFSHETDKQLDNHEKRITKLETKVV